MQPCRIETRRATRAPGGTPRGTQERNTEHRRAHRQAPGKSLRARRARLSPLPRRPGSLARLRRPAQDLNLPRAAIYSGLPKARGSAAPAVSAQSCERHRRYRRAHGSGRSARASVPPSLLAFAQPSPGTTVRTPPPVALATTHPRASFAQDYRSSGLGSATRRQSAGARSHAAAGAQPGVQVRRPDPTSTTAQSTRSAPRARRLQLARQPVPGTRALPRWRRPGDRAGAETGGKAGLGPDPRTRAAAERRRCGVPRGGGAAPCFGL